MRTLITLLLLLTTPLAHAASEPSHILYVMQAGYTERAMNLYAERAKEQERHDFELLHQMGLILLDQGWESSDPELKLMALFGAGISMDERATTVLERGAKCKYPQLQLIAMNFLSHYQNETSERVLIQALSSRDLLIRLEAALMLSQDRNEAAIGPLEALMCKIPTELHPFFPQFFAMIGTDSAMKVLRRLMHQPHRETRLEAIRFAALYGRDDLLPEIRRLAAQHDIIQQEVCAAALGTFYDEASIPRLQTLAKSPNIGVRLAALRSLVQLESNDAKQTIADLAKKGDIFAITALGDIAGSEELLNYLVLHGDQDIHLNATLALLERHDPRCAEPLAELLKTDPSGMVFLRVASKGKALPAYRVLPSAKQNLDSDLLAYELSLSMREETLIETLELPEKEFLRLAETLFKSRQDELVPTLVKLLENLNTPDAIALLKRYQTKAGAPLIRNYCNLALYRLGVEGPYGATLLRWIAQQQRETDLIRFRPMLPWEMRLDGQETYELTPVETSRLLVDAFETLAQRRDEEGVSILLEAIARGNPKNKYALAGLLIRATQ